MNWQTIKPWLGAVIRVVLGAVWLWASLAKLHNPRGFVQTVRVYDATPEWLSKAIGYGLPVLEFTLAILLILGVAVRMAAAVSAFLFVVFVIGLLQASARGIKLECGCFGGGGVTDGSTSYFLDVLRDLGLLVLAVYLIVWATTYISVEQYMARNDVVAVPSAKRLRTEQGRRKYEAQVAAVQTNARSRSVYLNGSLALISVLVVIIGIGVQSGRAKISGSLTAANATQTNGVVYGKSAAATVDVYEDFGCPICEAFEKSVHTQLDKDVVANLAQVRFHVISILDRNSPNQYSTRADNAGLCASDVSVDQFVAYHNLLYGEYKGKQVQPTEGTAGPTDADLVNYAKSLGFTSTQLTTFSTCVTQETHKALVEALTEKASERGVSGTPTVFVNGKKLGSNTLAALSAAIKAADAKGPKPSPSPTASPSVTSSASVSTTPSTSASVTPSSSATPSKTPSASSSK